VRPGAAPHGERGARAARGARRVSLPAMAFPVAAGVAAALVAPAEVAPPSRPSLEALLARLDKVASLYRDGALKFACDETITYTPAGQRPEVHRLEYIYVYDDRRDLIDYRTERRRPRPGVEPKPVDLGRSDLPVFVSRAYSWVFTFERKKQPLHRFTMLDDAKALGRQAHVIRFEPIPPYQEDINDWFGTAWIDRESLQVLRVEAMKADQLAEKQRFERHRAAPRPEGAQDRTTFYSFSEIATDFTVEKNGMRFPGLVTIQRQKREIKEANWYKYDRQLAGYTVTQRYDDYQFFGVRTVAEIRAITAE
ncbi:MAG: hypothetical protein ACREKH_11555, partial [Candidatus Rokuibacteriota bacterium]